MELELRGSDWPRIPAPRLSSPKTQANHGVVHPASAAGAILGLHVLDAQEMATTGSETHGRLSHCLVRSAAINYPPTMNRVPSRETVVRAARKSRLAEPQKTTKKPTRSRSKPPVIPGRVKLVWEICSGSGKVLKTFPYADKAAADTQTKALTWSSGRAHMLRATKVPM